MMPVTRFARRGAMNAETGHEEQWTLHSVLKLYCRLLAVDLDMASEIRGTAAEKILGELYDAGPGIVEKAASNLPPGSTLSALRDEVERARVGLEPAPTQQGTHQGQPLFVISPRQHGRLVTLRGHSGELAWSCNQNPAGGIWRKDTGQFHEPEERRYVDGRSGLLEALAAVVRDRRPRGGRFRLDPLPLNLLAVSTEGLGVIAYVKVCP